MPLGGAEVFATLRRIFLVSFGVLLCLIRRLGGLIAGRSVDNTSMLSSLDSVGLDASSAIGCGVLQSKICGSGEENGKIIWI